MTSTDNLNLNSTPVPTSYVDELQLSPSPKKVDQAQSVPTPELRISPTTEPLPSLEIYKNENSLSLSMTPTQKSPNETSGDSNGILIWVAAMILVGLFVAGVIFGIKNTPKS